jgi:zinc protease
MAAPDRYALDVLTAVLSGMSGRLFQAVRERQGFSYTLGAVNVPGWDPGYLVVYAATRPDEQDQVLAILQQQLEAVTVSGITEEELNQATQLLIGTHRLEVQHLLGLAKRCALDELYGLGANAWTQYEQHIRTVSVSQVQEVAKRYLRLPQRAEVVVGPNGALKAASK